MVRRSRRRLMIDAAGLAGLAWTARAAAAAGQEEIPVNVRIERVEAFGLIYPTRGRFKFFEDAQGRPVGRATVVVKLTASDGTVGWGQSVPTPRWSDETLESVYYTITRHLAPVLIGKNPFDIEGITAEMNRWIAPAFSTGQPICKAGLDLALFDLTGRLLGRTAAQRWNRPAARDRIQLSWTLNPRSIDEAPAMIEEGRSRGYRHFNIKVAPDIDFDVALCREVRRLVPDGFLWADANGGYEPAAALEAVPRLAEAGAAVLEQPVRINRFSAYRKLVEMKALPILMDEGIVSCAELEEFIRLGLLNGVAMKPARCGGLTEARRQIELCLQHGLMWLGSGLTDPDLSLAASLLLYGAYGLERPAALNGPQFLSGLSILKTPLIPVDGFLPVPTGPGLGVEVDEAALEEHRLRNL